MKKWTAFMSMIFTACITLDAFADNVPLRITPARIEIASNQKVKTVRVANQTGKPKAYRIEFETRYMKPEGGTEVVENSADYSAENMLRVSPRKLILEPGERQVIRVQARRGKALTEGDYFTHLKFVEVDLPKSLQERELEKLKAQQGAGMSFDIQTQINIAVPLTVSVGDVSSELQITGAKWMPNQGSMRILGVDLKRSGNGQGKGVINIVHKAEGADTTSPLATNVPVNLYRNLDEMTLRIPVRKDVSLKNGDIHLSLKNKKVIGQLSPSAITLPIEAVAFVE